MLQTCLKWTTIVSLFLITFLPLYVANDLLFPFITGKAFYFRMFVEIAFASYVLLALIDTKYRPRFSWVLVCFGALTLWMLIANFFAVNPHKAFWSNFERMDGWVNLIHVFLFFFVTSAFFTVEKLWKKWWGFFLGISFLMCLFAFVQASGNATINQGGVRVDGTLGNAIYLAVYMLFASFVSVWFALEAKSKWFKYTMFALALLQVIVMFMTGTRGAVVGFVAAVVFGVLLWLLEKGKKSRKMALSVLIGIVVVIGGFYMVRDTPMVQQNPILVRLASISLNELKTRATIWTMALEGSTEQPFTGWGQEGFNYVFTQNYKPSMYLQEPWFDRVHNMYLDWLIAGGIPAAVAFIALMIAAMLALYRNRTLSSAERILLMSALVAYGIQALAVFDNLFSYVPFAAVLAMAHGKSSTEITKVQEAPRVNDQSVQIIAVVLGVVLLCGTLWYVNIRNMTSASLLIQAMRQGATNPQSGMDLFKESLALNPFASQEIREQLVMYAVGVASQPSASSEIKLAVMNYAYEEINKELARAPRDVRLLTQKALLLRTGGSYADALSVIDQAIAFSPSKQGLYFEKANLLWIAGDMKSAQVVMNQAYNLDTSFAGVALYAATGDIMAGDVATGEALLVQHYGTTTVDNDILLRAYFVAGRYDNVVAIARQRVVASGNSAESRFQLAAIYAQVKRIAEAKEVIKALVAEQPELASQGDAFLKEIENIK